MEFSWLSIKNYLKTRDWKWLTKIICFVAIIALIITDQMVKWAVHKGMILNEEYKFMPGFINFKYIVNHGSAFSFFQNQRTFLITFAFLISIAGIIWLMFAKSITRSLGLSFVIAGTIGNLTDRFVHDGGVVDFLLWQLFPPYTVFNTADIFITIGIIIIILQLVIELLINAYQEKHGDQNNGTNTSEFTTITNNKPQVDNSYISRTTKRANRQIFSNSFNNASLFTKFYSKLNC